MLSRIARENPDKELLILGFVITNSEAYKKLKEAWNKQSASKQNYLGRSAEETKRITSDMLGGEIVLVDPEDINANVLGRVKVKTPMGLAYSEKRKILYTGSDHGIHCVSHGKVVQTINNGLFNCVHALSKTRLGNLLVTSTGIDAILEIDLSKSNELVYSWLAVENGYAKSANGDVRSIDRNVNYQGMEFSTPEHTTHVNSAIELDEKYLLATFFHQGYLVKINRLSGEVEVVLSGLKQPHNIRKVSFGYMLSDTNGTGIVKMNDKLEVIDEIKGNFNWIQDVIELRNGNLVIADSNNDEILIVDSLGFSLDELNYGNKKRIGVLSTIKAMEAKYIFCS